MAVAPYVLGINRSRYSDFRSRECNVLVLKCHVQGAGMQSTRLRMFQLSLSLTIDIARDVFGLIAVT